MTPTRMTRMPGQWSNVAHLPARLGELLEKPARHTRHPPGEL